MTAEHEESLDQVATLVRGISFRPNELLSNGSAGVPLLRATNIGNNVLLLDDLLYVPRDFVQEHQLLQRFDVVIAMSSGSQKAVGRLAQLQHAWAGCVGAFCGILRPRIEKIDPRYFGYLLSSRDYRLHLESQAVGTAIMNLSRDRVLQFRFHLPPRDRQEQVAAALGSLDDKIEHNRRTSRALEGLARAMFKAWFVDFEPVHAKAAGAASYPGMPPEAFAALPTRFTDSELGPVPEGWEVKPIESLCSSITSGGTPSRKSPTFWDGGTIDWFKTGELLDGPLLRSQERITPSGLDESSCKLWAAGTVLFALYASPTVGRLGVLTRPGTSNQAAAGLVARPEVGLGFLMQTLLHARSELQRIAVGAAQQNINQGVLKQHRIVFPGDQLARSFSAVAVPLFELQVGLAVEAEKLAELRDYLLPKLLSGEVRVLASAESEVASVHA